jgi:thioredoxin-related protein
MPPRRVLLLAGCMLPWACADASAADEALPAAGDLQALAASSARTRAPILILFTTPGCPYCREVRTHYLAPRLDLTGADRVLIREVDITSRDRLVDFDGRPTTEAEFAARFGVRMVPVVLAFDAAGQPVGEALVGLDRSGFYESYLQNLIDLARRRLAR